MMMNEDRPTGYSINWKVIGDRCVSTAAISSSSPYYGYFLTYETIIWGWNGKERTNIIHQVNHKNESEAKKVHSHIINNLKSKMKQTV